MSSKMWKGLIVVLLMISITQVAWAQNYKVGATPTGVPFTFLDTKTNSIQGVMVDLIKEVAKDQGFTVDIQGMPFNTLIPSLQTNKIDIISCALGITPQRAEVVDFSVPVYMYGEGVVVSDKDAKDYKSYDEFKGEIVGVQVGTVWQEPLKKTGIFKEVRAYDSMADAIRDVSLGRIKACFGDYPIVAYQIAQGVHKGVRMVKGIKPLLTVSIGMAVNKGDKEKLEKINKSLSKLQTNGTMENILAKWGLK
ncbi:MAG: ABC transporter substrate-binding protein [Deltaproteobacteria bacterium]|nr:ABC transporter substrate-binding protein [Deltaproteobacteria bacterium]